MNKALEEFGHVMIDIETLGTGSNSAILSIAAVEFNLLTGKTGKTFTINVNLKSCVDAGLQINPDTIMWWMKQSAEAKLDLLRSNPIPLRQTLNDLDDFINGLGYSPQIWGNSARFDLGILSDACNAIEFKIPWDFRKERCVRTLLSFYPNAVNEVKFEGTTHNALHDCYFQIAYCSLVWNKLKHA